jgi:glycosyltransferase involved in cell wall biosynthesis
MKFSVVIPVFNSEKTIETLVNRINFFFKSHNKIYEIILINDGSTDNSWDIISKISLNSENIISLDLLRNYGQHNAILCGFREASGDYVITLDDDLQNPPEEIEKFFPLIPSGYDLIIGKYTKKKHSFSRNIGSKVVHLLIKKIFYHKLDYKYRELKLSNFRLIKKTVVDMVVQNSPVDPYIPGMIILFSTNICNVEVNHEERKHDESGYSAKKLIKLIIKLLFNHSSIPLRFTALFGLLISLISFFASTYIFFNALFDTNKIPGWPSLAILISLFSGIVIFILSIIGEYIVFILRNFNNNQIYVKNRTKK